MEKIPMRCQFICKELIGNLMALAIIHGKDTLQKEEIQSFRQVHSSGWKLKPDELKLEINIFLVGKLIKSWSCLPEQIVSSSVSEIFNTVFFFKTCHGPVSRKGSTFSKNRQSIQILFPYDSQSMGF